MLRVDDQHSVLNQIQEIVEKPCRFRSFAHVIGELRVLVSPCSSSLPRSKLGKSRTYTIPAQQSLSPQPKPPQCDHPWLSGKTASSEPSLASTAGQALPGPKQNCQSMLSCQNTRWQTRAGHIQGTKCHTLCQSTPVFQQDVLGFQVPMLTDQRSRARIAHVLMNIQFTTKQRPSDKL